MIWLNRGNMTDPSPYLREMRTLSRALKLAELAGESGLATEEANSAIREGLPLLDGVAHCAAQVALGDRAVELPTLPRETPAQRLLETLTRIWLGWVSYRHRDPSWRSSALQGISHAVQEAKSEGEGLVHVLALQLAAEAIEGLLNDDLATARRRFEHALEVSSQHGVDGQLDLAWISAATFIAAS
jgi:hypothetical protein